MLEILGLTHKYPDKITTRDILTVNPNDNNEQEKEHISISDIPWLVLRRLICSNSECRDITAPNESIFDGIFQSDNAVSFISLQHDDKHDVSPLDIFFIIFQCCDPFLKQMCVQKLYLCKLAVPFMFTFCEPMKKQRSVLSVWPLRSLEIENRQIDKTDEQWQQNNILDLPTNMIAFGRLGRPRYSKSKLINSILSNEGCKTFFNIDCPSGMTQKFISNGHIEMFWLPTNGDKKDRFQEAMTFINLRGDMEQHFDKDIVKFIANFVDAVILIIDVDTILEKRKFVEDMLKNLPSVILIFANPLTQDTFKIIQSFQNDVLLCNPEIH
ncbi:up-regulator of cell proliferation-like [Ruditapes philippinarum]|uniref:up-regulator of cell proliferation-like n=1 Tax=Ruditapes philippinarum TaxID=129788 RepID=UPI00295A9AA6|nr:up-regulator of cell proliferation-like [Ruditapes philippinarum]